MAVAANAGCRPGLAPQRPRRLGDRLRRRVRRTRSHLPSCRGTELSRPRRRDAREAGEPSQQRRSLGGCDQPRARRRRSVGLSPCLGKAGDRSAADRVRHPWAGSEPLPRPLGKFASQRSCDRTGCRGPRGVYHGGGARRYRAPRAGDHGGAKYDRSVADVGNAPCRQQFRLDPRSRQSRRRSKRESSPASACRPITKDSCGSISIIAIPLALCRPWTC